MAGVRPERGRISGIGSFDFLEEEDGDLWIGTDAGLLRLRDGAFTIYDRAAGLPNESIFRVLKDAQGAFWLCSNQGVFRIEAGQFAQYDQGRLERLRVDVLQHADGMPSSQCNGGSSPAGNRDAEGRLWMPTAQGVAVIDPELTVSQALVKVPVRIEGVQLDARALPPQPQLTLDAGVRRVVIHYAGLHFRAPLRVRYRYRMLGFDHDWVEAVTLEAVCTNLPSGRLRFSAGRDESGGLEPGVRCRDRQHRAGSGAAVLAAAVVRCAGRSGRARRDAGRVRGARRAISGQRADPHHRGTHA